MTNKILDNFLDTDSEIINFDDESTETTEYEYTLEDERFDAYCEFLGDLDGEAYYTYDEWLRMRPIANPFMDD